MAAGMAIVGSIAGFMAVSQLMGWLKPAEELIDAHISGEGDLQELQGKLSEMAQGALEVAQARLAKEERREQRYGAARGRRGRKAAAELELLQLFPGAEFWNGNLPAGGAEEQDNMVERLAQASGQSSQSVARDLLPDLNVDTLTNLGRGGPSDLAELPANRRLLEQYGVI